MKIIIKIGDTSSGLAKSYEFEKLDDIGQEKKRMYDFLSECENCTIINVDAFLLYALNNGILAFIVKDSTILKDEDYKDEPCNLIPKFDPEIYRVFEIKEDGTEISLQYDTGNIGKNYFNILLDSVMDDYYSALTVWEM